MCRHFEFFFLRGYILTEFVNGGWGVDIKWNGPQSKPIFVQHDTRKLLERQVYQIASFSFILQMFFLGNTKRKGFYMSDY